MGDAVLELPKTDWSSAIRKEVSELAQCDGIYSDSASVWTATSGGGAPAALQIRFLIAAPGLTRPVVQFHDPEPMAFEWTEPARPGLVAPIVLALRSDFPRNLPHMNPVPDEAPAQPCLSRAGLNHIYQRLGIHGVAEALRRWLVDAAAGSLDPMEWHPEPLGLRALLETSVALVAEPARFQEIASERKTDGFVTGMACQVAPRLVRLFPELIDTRRVGNRASLLATACAKEYEAARRKGTPSPDYFPWILVWGESESQAFGDPRNLDELLGKLKEVGLDRTVTQALTTLEMGGAQCRRVSSKDKAVIVMVALKRSKPMLSQIPGLSGMPDARRYELAGFHVVAPTDKAIAEGSNLVARAMAVPWPGPGLFREISGLPRLGAAAIIGLGALGGALSEYLLRSGMDLLVAIDKDGFQPHNLARHPATLEALGKTKVEWADQFAGQLGWKNNETLRPSEGTAFTVWGHNIDVVFTPDDELKQVLVPVGTVIDATADTRVRSRLAALGHGRLGIRTEMYDLGRLGVLSVGSTTGNPDTLDLYYALPMLRDRHEGVLEWLNREAGGSESLQEIILGFGCASVTTRLPKYAIDQHAAAMMPTIVDVLRPDRSSTGSGIGVNRLDEGYRPLGWRWFDVPAFHEFGHGSGWTVRIAPPVVEAMRLMRTEALPVETGGYLFGGWDRQAKRVTVVAATPAPPGSRGSPTLLDLAGVHECSHATALIRRMAGRIHLVGTWHSHPDLCPRPSPTDMLTISRMAAINRDEGIPTLMLIQSGHPLPAMEFAPA